MTLPIVKKTVFNDFIRSPRLNQYFFPGFLIFIMMVLSGNSSAQKKLYLIRQGSIRFYSEAPMESIRGTSQKLKGVINASDRTFAFSVFNRSITGFNSQLQQEHFYENYIEADKFPNSSFEGKIIEQIDFLKEGEHSVRAKGFLNIHGVPKERIIKGTLRIKNGVLFIKAHFSILLEDHNIKIPRIVLQKIAREVGIDVEAEFKLAEPAAK